MFLILTTANAQLTNLVAECFKNYKDAITSKEESINDAAQCQLIHESSEKSVMQQFEDTPKTGDENQVIKFRNMLDRQIKELFEEWQSKVSIKVSMKGK